MAKVPFSKLKCKSDNKVEKIWINDEVEIEILQYLPIQEKLKLISTVIELAHMQDENYSNPVKVAIFKDLEIIFYYTNLTFTDKQKEDIPKLYDMLYSSGVLQNIIDNIPHSEYEMISIGIEKSIAAIYNYQNSVLGILHTITEDYNDLNLDINNIIEQLNDQTNFETLQNIGKIFVNNN